MIPKTMKKLTKVKKTLKFTKAKIAVKNNKIKKF